MADFRIGKVTHYYDKIGVAIIELDGEIGIGDKIKFVRGGEEIFEQEVSSMQVEHEQVTSARKGDVVGLKIEKGVKDGAEVYKVQ